MDGILDKKQVLVQLGSLRIHLQSNPEKSRESSLALTKIDEAIMWLEKDAGKQLDELEAVGIIPCENTISKTHIERMEDELQALETKLDNLCTFLEKEMEEPQYTNEYQRQLLAIQMSHMIGYYNTLLARIDNDKNIKKEV